jgi:hypothetical protein
VLSAGGSLLTLEAASPGAFPLDPIPFIWQAALFLFISALVVTVRCAGAVTGERERQTWDSLRLTPLDGRAFIHGKLRGILSAAASYYVAYAAPAIIVSFLGGEGAILATIVGLAMACPAIYYAACCGLRASAFARSTWRGLLVALLYVYLTGTLVGFATVLGTGLFCMCLIIPLLGAGPFPQELLAVLYGFVTLFASGYLLVALARAQLRQAYARAITLPDEPPLPLDVLLRKSQSRSG